MVVRLLLRMGTCTCQYLQEWSVQGNGIVIKCRYFSSDCKQPSMDSRSSEPFLVLERTRTPSAPQKKKFKKMSVLVIMNGSGPFKVLVANNVQ